MAVTFDAVGPSSAMASSATASISWTHTPVGTPTEVVVYLSVSTAAAFTMSFTTVTYGGNAMTLAKSQEAGGSGFGFGGNFCYKLASPPSGAQTVAATCSVTPTDHLYGVSVSVTGGGGGFGTAVSGFGGPAVTTGSIAVTGTTTGGLCIAGACDGSGVESPTAGTQRWLLDLFGPTAASNNIGLSLASAGGGASTTLSWTQASDAYGVIGIEILPAGGAPAPAPPPYVRQLPPGWFPGSDAVVTQPGLSPFLVPSAPAAVSAPPSPVLPVPPLSAAPLPPGWFPGSDGASTEPDGVPFYVQPLPVAAAPAVIIPPAPDILGTPDWFPYPPNWFPGGDHLSGAPAGIPFWIQPQPDSSPQLPRGRPSGYRGAVRQSTSAGWFQDQFSNPRWAFIDAVWTIVYSAGRSAARSRGRQDIDQFVTTRASQGYTGLECNLLPNNEYVTSGGTTWDGVAPFVTGVDPGSGLTSAYWARVDYLLASAASHGITMFLNLLMGEDLASGVAGGWTSGQKTSFGQAVAARYLGTANLVWVINDDGGVDLATLSAILTGVRNTGDTRPVSVENDTETTSRTVMKTGAAAAGATLPPAYNWVYSYNVAYLAVEFAYTETSPIPVLRGDGLYYVSGLPSGKEDLTMRNHLWWSVASGSRGFSGGVSDGGWNAFATGWQAGLTVAGEEAGTAGDYQNHVFPAVTAYLTTLRGWQKLKPDTGNVFITAGRGTRATAFNEGLGSTGAYDAGGGSPDTYVAGSVATDGTLAVVYFSPGVTTTITVNQALLGTGYTATWLDPANCTTSAGTPGATFTKPASANSAGDHDWILLLQGPPPSPIAAPGLPEYLHRCRPPGSRGRRRSRRSRAVSRSRRCLCRIPGPARRRRPARPPGSRLVPGRRSRLPPQLAATRPRRLVPARRSLLSRPPEPMPRQPPGRAPRRHLFPRSGSTRAWRPVRARH